ncbi:MAG: esterase-like activity of phytase family protein [Kiritimatiellae bacterium]|nr:esterase-like activity of phytase family protein [Kiritimatiellia bacterium]
MRTLRLFPALAALLAASVVRGAISITAGSTATHQSSKELSGIAWAGGNQYYAVEDQEGALYPLTISVTSSGGISCSVGTPITLANASDLEGCAWDPGAGTVWVSMESSSTPIREYNPTTGEQLRTAPVPSIYISNRRGNYSLEALTISGDGLTMWTCNEESLTCDGDRSTSTNGTVVRLARFTRASVRANWVANGQWAYLTDSLREDSSLSSTPRSGVSGLCALPDGNLLVLEREFSGSSIRIRIYQVNFTGADNIETLPGLAGQIYTRVSKTKLYESTGYWSLFGSSDLANYEGICLGPRTTPNQAALVTIADGGSSGEPRVQHLKLTGLDIATVTYTGPTGAEPVGGPYRYVAGSTVAATLPTAGDPYESQLRAHANWSSGGSTGDGSTASFTAPAGDSTFAWSFSTNNALPLLATDSFERNPVAAEADDIANWSGDGWVAEETYSAPASGYPLPLEAHTRVLAVDGDVERDYADAPGNGSRLDADVRVTRATADSPVAEVATPLQVALYFDEQGRPTLQHMAANGSARTVTTLSQTSYENGSWVRVGFVFDYTTGASGTGWCQVSINGTPCSTSAGVAAPSRTNASGSWYRVIGSGATKVSSLTLKGSGAVDDLALYDDEPAPVNVPATVFWVGGTP